MAELDPAFGHWLAGFIDGEGSFGISRPQRLGAYVIYFDVMVRGDDRPVLEEIQGQTGIGAIYDKPRRNHPPCVRWHVQNRRDVARLIEILDEFPLRAKKRHDYEIWRRAAQVRAASVRPRGRVNGNASAKWQLAKLKRELEAGRRYDAAPVPTIEPQAEPEALWSS